MACDCQLDSTGIAAIVERAVDELAEEFEGVFSAETIERYMGESSSAELPGAAGLRLRPLVRPALRA